MSLSTARDICSRPLLTGHACVFQQGIEILLHLLACLTIHDSLPHCLYKVVTGLVNYCGSIRPLEQADNVLTFLPCRVEGTLNLCIVLEQYILLLLYLFYSRLSCVVVLSSIGFYLQTCFFQLAYQLRTSITRNNCTSKLINSYSPLRLGFKIPGSCILNSICSINNSANIFICKLCHVKIKIFQ